MDKELSELTLNEITERVKKDRKIESDSKLEDVPYRSLVRARSVWKKSVKASGIIRGSIKTSELIYFRDIPGDRSKRLYEAVLQHYDKKTPMKCHDLC